MIKVTTEHPSGEALKAEVDADIEKFEEYFKTLGNDPLAPSEKAIISTYLWYKTQVKEMPVSEAQ